MAAQTLFSRAVGHHLPSAISVHLERVDDYVLGKVRCIILLSMPGLQYATCTLVVSEQDGRAVIEDIYSGKKNRQSGPRFIAQFFVGTMRWNVI